MSTTTRRVRALVLASSLVLPFGVAVWAIHLGNRISLPFDIDFSADLRLSPAVLGFTLAIFELTAALGTHENFEQLRRHGHFRRSSCNR